MSCSRQSSISESVGSLVWPRAAPSRGPFANHFASIRAILRRATGRLAPSREIRANFFFEGESDVPGVVLARRACVPHAVKKQAARRYNNLTHHRNGHLTGVFAILQVLFAEDAAVEKAGEPVLVR